MVLKKIIQKPPRIYSESLAELLLDHFQGRSDCYAESCGKGFRPIECELTAKIIEDQHLADETCLGVYYMLPGDRVVWSAVDIDNHEGRNPDWQCQIEAVSKVLRDENVPHLVEVSQSGSGGHVWIFFQKAISAWVVLLFWEGISKKSGFKLKEIYPRQAELLGKGYGNLMRLPLWNKSHFVDVVNGWRKLAPVEALRKVKKIDRATLKQVVTSCGMRMIYQAIPEPAEVQSDKPFASIETIRHWIDKCDSTPVGERSEACYVVLKEAVRHRVSRDELWEEVRHISKFSERNYEWFVSGWEKAQKAVANDPVRLSNRQNEKKLPIESIANTLFRGTDDFPKRVGDQLFVLDKPGVVLWLNKATKLFAWIESKMKVNWQKGVTKEEFYEHLCMQAQAYEAVETLPHWPEKQNTFYTFSGIPEPTGGKYFDELVNRFSPASTVDRSLIQAFFITPFWGGPPAQRPAFVLTGPADDQNGGRGVGKTTLVRTNAALCGGMLDIGTKIDFQKVKTRMLSDDACGKRIALMDNLKSYHFSSAELESIITSEIISGHRMYKGEGQILSFFTWVITVNGPCLSKDLADRSVIVKLKRPQFSGAWESETKDFIKEHRWKIIGDILEILNSKPEKLPCATRWATWEREVLSKLSFAAKCQEVIQKRQTEIDGDAEQAKVFREKIRSELRSRKLDPDTTYVFIPTSTVAMWYSTALDQKVHANRATIILKSFAFPELKTVKLHGDRGWYWRGCKAQKGAKLQPLPKWKVNNRP